MCFLCFDRDLFNAQPCGFACLRFVVYCIEVAFYRQYLEFINITTFTFLGIMNFKMIVKISTTHINAHTINIYYSNVSMLCVRRSGSRNIRVNT